MSDTRWRLVTILDGDDGPHKVVVGASDAQRVYGPYDAKTTQAFLDRVQAAGLTVTGSNPWHIDANQHGISLDASQDAAGRVTVTVATKNFYVGYGKIWDKVDPLMPKPSVVGAAGDTVHFYSAMSPGGFADLLERMRGHGWKCSLSSDGNVAVCSLDVTKLRLVNEPPDTFGDSAELRVQVLSTNKPDVWKAVDVFLSGDVPEATAEGRWSKLSDAMHDVTGEIWQAPSSTDAEAHVAYLERVLEVGREVLSKGGEAVKGKLRKAAAIAKELAVDVADGTVNAARELHDRATVAEQKLATFAKDVGVGAFEFFGLNAVGAGVLAYLAWKVYTARNSRAA